MIATSRSGKALLAVLPLLIFMIGLGVRAIQGPHSLAQNYDPDYAYLFNGLNILGGKTPGHTDHPGTPLQVMTAALLAGWNHVAGDGRDPVGQVIADPDGALSAVNLGLLALLAGSLWLAGFLALKGGRGLVVALSLQGGLFLFPVAIPFLGRVTPEIVLMGVCPLVAVLLLTEGGPRRAATAGMIYALGITLKVVAFPVATLGLLLKTKARLAWFAGAAAISAMVFLLPAWGRTGEMAQWFEAVLTRSGTYGSGEPGLPAMASLAAGAQHLARQEPFFLVWPLFALAAAWGTGRVNRPLYAAAAGMAIQFALVTKHPEPRYLLPSFTLAVLCAALALSYAEGRRAWVAAWWVLLAANIVFSVHETSTWASHQLRFRAQLEVLDAAAAKHPECMVAGAYRSSLKMTSVMFGDHYSAYHHADRIRILYPEALELGLAGGRFLALHGENVSQRTIDHLRAGGCLLVEGTEFRMSQLPAGESWLVERIAGTDPAPMAARGESLYLIRLGANGTSKSD